MTNDDPSSEEPIAGQSETRAAAGTLPLIGTKIRVPRRQPGLLPRQRLVDFFHDHLDRRLILLSAPAGYGKTTLLTDFAHDCELPVCWYTLDPFDRDLHVFLEYLVAAIANRFPAFGERSRTFLKGVADPGRDLYSAVAVLVQEIYDTIPEYFVLVLDDHHTVEDQESISEFLAMFTTYMDENCHLVLASRTLPTLSNLTLLVARRQAVGLSIDELRFTPHEIQEWAKQSYDRELSLEQAGSLAERTGGWITGLLLSAVPAWQQDQGGISIRGRIDVDLYDYLSSQVLNRQPPHLREFLLASSVLDELSPDLCSDIVGAEPNRPADLMELVRDRQLFVTEFEGDDSRLRYHDLFREFLSTSLRRQDEGRFVELTRRAAQAYATRGEWERAVSRYLELRDWEQVSVIVEQNAIPMHEAGRWDTLAGWIDALPDAVRASHPRFLVYRGRIHMERGEHTAALSLYGEAERAFGAAGDRTGMASAVAMAGYVLRFQGHYAEALDCCRRAMSLVNGDSRQDRFTRALTQKNAGLCYLRLGKREDGLDALQQARGLYEALDDPYDLGSVLHDLGLAYELAGDLDHAMEQYQAALQRWEQLGNPSPWANTLNGLGVVYQQQGKYDEALLILNKALVKAQQAGDPRVEGFTLTSLGDLHSDLGAWEQARQVYDQAYHIAQRAGAGFVTVYALDGLGNTYRRQGDRGQARKWLQEALARAEAHNSGHEIGLCCTSLGILANEEGDTERSRLLLDRAVELLEAGGFQRNLVRAYLHRANAAFLAGKQAEALVDVERALTLAQNLVCDQFLIVETQQIEPLLQYAVEQGTGGDSLRQLVDRVVAHQAQMAVRPEPVVEEKPQRILSIYALGQARVELNGRAVQWTVTQSRDLFFCLLQHRSGLRKEDLGQIFWPEHEPHRLNSIFRSTLYRLRRSLFRESVLFEDDLYRFNREATYWFDVEEFSRLLDQIEDAQAGDGEAKIAPLEQALALYQGDYLAGIYDDWCAFERQELRERYLAALDMLASLRVEQGDLQVAIELYQRILVSEPYQEVAHRAIMDCHYRLGDRAAAIRQYQACVEILREDLGLSPMPETEELYLKIIS